MGNSIAHKQLSKEERIEKSNKIHDFKYDYSKIDNWKTAKERVIVTCPIHGDFSTTYDNHVNRKHGCPKCSPRKKYDKSFFVEEAKKRYGDQYDYSMIEDFSVGDINVRDDKLPIVCKKHGLFYSTIDNHLRYGCKKCGFERSGNARRVPFEDFLKLAHEVHGDKYCYDKETFTKMQEKMRIICPKHGEFWQTPLKHINSKQGCPMCKTSKLEEKTSILLKENDIKYKVHYMTKWLGCQHLDFFLEEFNIGIECQGEQHFLGWFENGNLNEIIKNDKKKYQLCANNGVKIVYVVPKAMMSTEVFKKEYNDKNVVIIDNLAHFLQDKKKRK